MDSEVYFLAVLEIAERLHDDPKTVKAAVALLDEEMWKSDTKKLSAKVPSSPFRKSMMSCKIKSVDPKPPDAGESYFANCERDDEGRCLPLGEQMTESENGPKKRNIADESSRDNFHKPEGMDRRTKEVGMRQIRPMNITGYHAGSSRKVKEIAESMREDGWIGPPLVVMKDEDVWQALTGSHRLAAAVKADLDSVPVIFVDQSDVLSWAKSAGYDLPDDADLTDLEDEDRAKIFDAGDDDVAKAIIKWEFEKL